MREALLALAESIADGTHVDWEEAGRHAQPQDQPLVRQLSVLAKLTAVHRTIADAPPAPPLPARRSQATPAIGTWAHLTLLERLGGGTFGDVYRARDRQLEREVALKLLRAPGADDDPETSRITREGRLLARVRHPNVITVHGVDVHDGRVGLWMELLHGDTLEQLLRSRGAFGAREAALVGIDLCRALAAIHAAGLLHRDVKAENVIRENGGRIVLMDLGTGREIDPGGRRMLPDFAGTPLYIAPEVFDGAPASQATDVYSLGVLLYHLVTGSYPVWAKTVEELRQKHKAAGPMRLRDARADLPSGFVGIIDRAIATDTARRYPTAGALEADLLRSLEGEGGMPHRRVGAVAAVVAAVSIGAALLAWPSIRGGAAAATATPIRSIAVLPLANVSGDPSQEYFADGMTDELIGTLGHLPGVNVISRTSAMQFKGSGKPVAEIARALKVDAVLEGTVLVSNDSSSADPRGKRVRINGRLIRAGTDTQLWNRTFEHALTDAISLQSEVANAVAADLHVRLTPEAQRALAAPASQISGAQDAYLEGRALLTNSNVAGLTRARQALERAVQLDPRYARAHASLSVCYVWLELMGALPRGEARTLALASARRALDLDPNLAEAHAALADILFFYDWNWNVAGEEYRRALALSPNYSFARGQYAWYLAARGDTGDAVRQATLAAETDPLAAEAVGALGVMLYFNRDYPGALRQLQRAASLAPNSAQQHGGLSRAYAAVGDFPTAVREMEDAVRLSGNAPVYVAGLARLHARAGNAGTARALLPRAQAAEPTVLALVHVALGESDRAFDLLNRSVRERSPNVLWARVDPRLDPIRQDRRFTQLTSAIAATTLP